MDNIISTLYLIKDKVVVGDDDSVDLINKLIDKCKEIVIPEPGISQGDFSATPSVAINDLTINIYPPSKQ